MREAVAWLVRAQDSTPDDGFARGYDFHCGANWRRRGWQPSYPETTGYIIPTLMEVAARLERPELLERTLRAARWECEIQLRGGAVQGGVIGSPPFPAVFNTGQVIFGWIAAHRQTNEDVFVDSARRAADFLVDHLDSDGIWRRGNSRHARGDSTLYNVRVAWALAEAGRYLDLPRYLEAAQRALDAVKRAQHDDGWMPSCCLTDPVRPLLHTLAYAIRGELECGRVLSDQEAIERAQRAAGELGSRVDDRGWLPGRFAAGWQNAAKWSCLTGMAQMANVWLRLHTLSGDRHWLEPVGPVLEYLKSTQNRTSSNAGLRGGIKGSVPFTAEYGRLTVLNWATKFFVDALLRDEDVRNGTNPRTGQVFDLA